MRYDLTTVEGGRSYFLTTQHVDAIMDALQKGTAFVRFPVNNESVSARPIDLILNVNNIAAILGSREASDRADEPGIMPDLLPWYVGEFQELGMGSMLVPGRICTTARPAEYIIDNGAGYQFLIEPKRVNFMRRVSTDGAAPRYIHGNDTEPPICLSTPGSDAAIRDFATANAAVSVAKGAATHVLAFIRGIGHDIVARGGTVLVIDPQARGTFAALGIDASAHGALLTNLESYDLVVGYDVKEETALDLATKTKRLLVTSTTNGRRAQSSYRALIAARMPAIYNLPDDEPRIETV